MQICFKEFCIVPIGFYGMIVTRCCKICVYLNGFDNALDYDIQVQNTCIDYDIFK